MKKLILEAKGITKTFPGVKALDNVDFQLQEGEVHAVVGENGAGKSTLMYILGGIYQPDSGNLYLHGNKVVFGSPSIAASYGVSVVFQELSLVPNLSVAENIFANRQPVSRFNIIKWQQLYARTRQILSLFNVDIEPHVSVKELPLSKQQVVEILKAMSHNPKILILDEPTSCLTEVETAELFRNIRRLKQMGVSIIYISHHLREIFEIADRVTVLRDGKYVATHNIAEVTEEKVVSLMVGRELSDVYGHRKNPVGEEYFKVEGLTKKGKFYNISFSLHRGEILGIAGLIGAGRTELARAIFGIDPPDEGEIILEGKKINGLSPQELIKQGLGYITEDRKNEGLYLKTSYRDNVVAPQLSNFCTILGFLDDTKINSFADEYRKRFRIAIPDIYRQVRNLSGGNQQKVLISMWVGTSPKLLIVDEPTRGVDVGARSDIYHFLRQISDTGVGIIMISSDLPELLGMCDRILVMRQGSIVAEFTRAQATEEKVIAAATGVTNNGN